MIQTVIEKIDQLVMEIYTSDQKEINTYYLEFIDAIGGFIQDMMEKGYTVDLRQDLERIQKAADAKDYIALSDILKYEVRKDFVNLAKELCEK